MLVLMHNLITINIWLMGFETLFVILSIYYGGLRLYIKDESIV